MFILLSSPVFFWIIWLRIISFLSLFTSLHLEFKYFPYTVLIPRSLSQRTPSILKLTINPLSGEFPVKKELWCNTRKTLQNIGVYLLPLCKHVFLWLGIFSGDENVMFMYWATNLRNNLKSWNHILQHHLFNVKRTKAFSARATTQLSPVWWYSVTCGGKVLTI